MTIAIVVTIAALIALLIAESREHTAGVWITKPIASTGFIATSIAAGALDSTYGQAIVAALVLSWWGDVLLIPKSKKFFLAGLVAFLLGHVGFAAAFVIRGVEPAIVAGAAVGLAVIAAIVAKWLMKHVEGGMKGPVVAYILVITTMVALASGTKTPMIIAGAVCFFISDLAVARRQFVAKGFINKLWGLPLYYGAQLILACTV